MTIFNRKARILCTAFAGTALFVAACGDDSTDPPSQVLTPDGGDDPDASGNGGNGGSGGNAGNGGTGGDVNNDPDASDGSVPGTVNFLVPANGGDVELPFGDETITFTFPASAAGENITLTLADAGDIGWDTDDFSIVIRMEPDGLVFDDPVIVTPSSGELIAMTFPQPEDENAPEQSAPEQLELASDGSGFELNHFSYLTFGRLLSFCEDRGITETPNHQLCANEGAASTLRTFSCDKYRFCSHTEGYCCVEPGDASGADCLLSSTGITYSFNHLADVTGDFPYCGPVGDGGDLPDGSGDGGFVPTTSCQQALTSLIGDANYPSAAFCTAKTDAGVDAGGVGCAVALDWELGVSCDNFCASSGNSCVYAGLMWGSSTGADCDAAVTPPTTPTTECGTTTDADILCYCDGW